jgi:undecaprenyl diphosphate synthase
MNTQIGKMSLLSQIKTGNIPNHVAIIMDGNGRWAKQQGQERLFGHAIGVEAVRETLRAAAELGVKYLTLYAFSTENWNRPKEEVDGLMDLLVRTISNEVDALNQDGVKLMSIGNVKGLPIDCQEELKLAEKATETNQRVNLVLALNYSAKWEITNAVRNIAHCVKNGDLNPDDIDESTLESYLSTQGIPDPELLIRTSGEHRISNFLLWQIAYSEFYFCDKLWPDFKQDDFYDAISNYQKRERRFGMVSEQLK